MILYSSNWLQSLSSIFFDKTSDEPRLSTSAMPLPAHRVAGNLSVEEKEFWEQPDGKGYPAWISASVTVEFTGDFHGFSWPQSAEKSDYRCRCNFKDSRNNSCGACSAGALGHGDDYQDEYVRLLELLNVMADKLGYDVSRCILHCAIKLRNCYQKRKTRQTPSQSILRN